MNITEITPALINEAVTLYLRHAYDSSESAAGKAVKFAEDDTAKDIVSRFRDESDPRPEATRSYVLQLGSEEYPHMKLALWEAYFHDEFVFAIDCHDGFRFDENCPDYQEWLKVKDRNRLRKQQIELSWYDAGLPTLRRLKETSLSTTDCLREFKGQEVLLVDDDQDSAAIMQMLLRRSGIDCRWLAGVREARNYIGGSECRCGLAMIDVVLRDGTGVDVLKILRGEPRTQDIPVVFVSALNGSDVHAVGVNHYLRRPFSARELIDTVTRILREEYDGHQVFLERKPGELEGRA